MTRLARMKLAATGLLVAAAVTFVVASVLEPRHPWLFYVAATAEAAMIGAIADWFAVVALFHHPLGLRFIPHTAIVPRNKGRIARGLSDFIQLNLLSTDALVERIRAFRPAQTLCAWLLKEENAAALAAYGARMMAFALDALDDVRVREFLARNLAAIVRRADVAGAAAQVLDVLTENRRHHALLDEALGALDELLSREETRRAIAAEVARKAPGLLKGINELLHLRLDERAAMKIVEMALAKLAEVRRDQDHEIRRRFDAFVAVFIYRLKRDDALRARVEAVRDDVLANEALARYAGDLWRELRGWLAADLAAESSATRARLAAMAASLGRRVAADAAIQRWIDEQILVAVPPLVAEHRAAVGRFVEDQINAWQEKRLVAELERHIGPDLQYIRVNGTLVGGAVGLLLALATQALRG